MQAVLTDIRWTLVYIPQTQYLKSTPRIPQQSQPTVPFPWHLSIATHRISFTQQEEEEGGRSPWHAAFAASLTEAMDQWVFAVMDCETIKHFIRCLVERDSPPHKDDFTPLHPTLQTKSPPFFCTKSGKYYNRIDYIYTNTPYMLNTVNMFSFYLYLAFFWLCVLHLFFIFPCSSCQNIFVAIVDDLKCSSVKKNKNELPLTHRGANNPPRGRVPRWEEKRLRDFIFGLFSYTHFEMLSR